jgi:hypothetical protein
MRHFAWQTAAVQCWQAKKFPPLLLLLLLLCISCRLSSMLPAHVPSW